MPIDDASSKVVPVAFGPRRTLERLGVPPEPTEKDDVGDTIMTSDGDRIFVFKLSPDRQWKKILVYNGQEIVDLFYRCRSIRRRAEEKIGCERGHDYKKNRECVRCGALRPPQWRICRGAPLASSQDITNRRGPNGESLCFIHSNTTNIVVVNDHRCRRREGHDGPCSWQRPGGLPEYRSTATLKQSKPPAEVVGIRD